MSLENKNVKSKSKKHILKRNFKFIIIFILKEKMKFETLLLLGEELLYNSILRTQCFIYIQHTYNDSNG